MCAQVVAAARGLEQIVLLETVVFLVHTEEGLCFSLAAIAREGLPAALLAASTTIVGRVRYSVVIPPYRVEVVTKRFWVQKSFAVHDTAIPRLYVNVEISPTWVR